ncbi:MAG: ferrous iron transporter B [Candidatus Omnitrophica bacterium]|nr:ferrous iron transporter B [Candidatus Omnitrophota bacterium]MBU4589431.1 ferrous iron transporter B [Candidatus Omnitrophota bacterium]
MNKILLMGNPNVGKSVIFSRLTGARIIVSNYPGTTVEFTQGHMKIDEERPAVIDVPGTYNLEPTSKAEEVAVRMLKDGDLIINVVNATNLERNLYLTLQLLEKNISLVVALNMWDETKHQGINIDIERLEKELGVPVVPTCGLTGEGIKELIIRLKQAKTPKAKITSDSDKWERIGEIIERVQKLTHHHHTFLQRLEDLSIRPLSGIPIALGVIYAAFTIIRFIGEGLITYIFEPLFDKAWAPIMLKLGAVLGEDTFLHNVLVGNLIDGAIDFKMSFGVLTTGFFVPIAMVLPYIISFYLMLGILEDFGYLPRLAVMVDNLMHHIGLHGFAIIPMMLGLGCNVPGALAIRILEGRREKFIAATLMAVAIPCMAQIAMIVGLVGERGGQYLGIIFGTLFILLIVKGLIMNKVLKGSSPEILVEIPPYRIPQLEAVVKKLWMRVSGFLKEAVPYVLLGILFVNILYALKIIDFFSRAFSPILTGLWGLPKEAISALIIGFLRKDVAVGMLGPLNLTTKQLVIGSTVLAIYFPCIATFVMLVKELGIKDMLKSATIMIFVALIVGTLLNIIL